ncbi:MAG: DUF362 domain-containing protein [bacterium]|nr:DUF362 domain-containing protein [bacterium]
MIDQIIPKLAIADWTPDQVADASAVNRIVSLASGPAPLVTPGQQVLIKSQLLTTARSTGTTGEGGTGYRMISPSIILALANTIRDQGGEPMICGPTLFSAGKESEYLKSSGLRQFAERNGLRLVNLSASGVQKVKIRGRVYWISKAFLSADIFVNLVFPFRDPTGRIHGVLDSLAHYQPGFGKEKQLLTSHAKSDRADLLADLLSIRRPDLNLVELNSGLSMTGRQSALLCSADPVALDSYLGKALKSKELSRVSAYAAASGLGVSDLELIQLQGEWDSCNPKEIRLTKRPGSRVSRLFRKLSWPLVSPLTRSGVRVNEKSCLGCGICSSACSSGAMRSDSSTGLPALKRSECCLCFSCAENCPNGSISIRNNRVLSWVGDSWRKNCAV